MIHELIILTRYISATAIFLVCHVLSVTMTLVKDDYRWSSIRHIATVVLLIFTAMTNSLLVLQIKKILSGRSVAMEGKASDSDDESEDTMVVDTEKAIQKRLNILLCIYIPVRLEHKKRK